MLPDGRRGGLCWDEKPRCPFDHRLMTKAPILDDGIVTCTHRHYPAPECGAKLYVACFTFGGSAAVRGSGERAWLVVEVTREHIERMIREPMIFLERAIVLGLTVPGVEVDVMTLTDPQPIAS